MIVGWMDRLMGGHSQSGVLSLLSGVPRRVRSATGPPVKSTALRGLGSRRLRGRRPRSMKCRPRLGLHPTATIRRKKGATLQMILQSCVVTFRAGSIAVFGLERACTLALFELTHACTHRTFRADARVHSSHFPTNSPKPMERANPCSTSSCFLRLRFFWLRSFPAPSPPPPL